jgi:hypothetical protein
MKQSEVEIGGVYRVRWHDGSFTEVGILGIKRYPVQQNRYPYRTIGSKARFSARNLATGRVVTIKSAAKLRERVR